MDDLTKKLLSTPLTEAYDGLAGTQTIEQKLAEVEAVAQTMYFNSKKRENDCFYCFDNVTVYENMRTGVPNE